MTEGFLPLNNKEYLFIVVIHSFEDIFKKIVSNVIFINILFYGCMCKKVCAIGFNDFDEILLKCSSNGPKNILCCVLAKNAGL